MITALALAVIGISGFAVFVHFACRRMLRREFEHDYYLSVVHARDLEFADVRRVLEDFTAPLNFSRLRDMLSRDFHKVLDLVDIVPTPAEGHWTEVWLPVANFQMVRLGVSLFSLVGLPEKPGLLKLAAMLRYLANLAGQRVHGVQITNPAFAELLGEPRAEESVTSALLVEFETSECAWAPPSGERVESRALLSLRDRREVVFSSW